MKPGRFAVAVALTALVTMPVLGDDPRPEHLSALGPPPEPADNPSTPEKIELGKKLFFDPKLSGNNGMPCSNCHVPAVGWDVPSSISPGYPGTAHWRNSQTIVNSAYYGKLFWAGASKSFRGQARSAARGGVAGNGEDDVMEARLALVPEYREAFREVFGDSYPKVRNAYMAIAAFERTLVQRDTPFDQFMRGDDDALSRQQKRGLELFTGKANCIACHSGPLLSDQKYYNIGVPPHDGWEKNALAQITFRYEIYSKGASEDVYRSIKSDPGLYFQTKQKRDMGKFRTPSLRYTKYTAPYMHNGSLPTLRAVVEFYNEGGGKNDFSHTKSPLIEPLGLTDQEVNDLLAFLETLSGDPIQIERPDVPDMEPLPRAPADREEG